MFSSIYYLLSPPILRLTFKPDVFVRTVTYVIEPLLFIHANKASIELRF